MIYFDRSLQDRVHELFYDSLETFGVLALGHKESIRFTPHEDCFEELDASGTALQEGRDDELVAIGASWGGLSALSILLDALPREFDAAVVVAQHRAADSATTCASLLHARVAAAGARGRRQGRDRRPARSTSRRPTTTCWSSDGRFALSTDAPVQFARPSLDVLFESAADAYGDRLRRRRPDGRERRRRRRACTRSASAGGVAIVQEPETAERPEMPAAALAAAPTARMLPLERDRAAARGAVRHEGRRLMANILLVDDRPENLLALEAILEPLGQNLVTRRLGRGGAARACSSRTSR